MNHDRVNDLADELLALLEDPDFARRSLPPASFWSIVHYGESSYENRYNRVVRWLLDPTENHGLDAGVANALIARTGKTVSVGTRRVRTRVETPVPATKLSDGRMLQGRIDVTLVDHVSQVVIVIESKMSSVAHDEQLSRYREHIETAYPNWRRFFVFLTEADEQADDEGWTELTYLDFAALLSDLAEGRKLAPEVSHLINDFIADIRRRAEGPIDERIGELYFVDHHLSRPIQNRFADLLVAVAADLEPDPAAFEDSRIAGLGRHLDEVAGQELADKASSPEVFEGILARIEEVAGRRYSASDVTRVLTYVIEHAPRVGGQEHALQPGIEEFYKDYFAFLTGTPLTRARREALPVLPEHGLGGYLREVKMNQGGKGLTFNPTVGAPPQFRVSGNDADNFPDTIAHHLGPGGNYHKCGIAGGRLARRRLDEWTVSSLHGEILAALSAFLEDTGDCGCGEPLVGPASREA